MTLVSSLLERVFREFLDSTEDQPTRFVLDGAISATADSLVYDDTLLSPEEEDIMGPGTLIEIGSEEIVVGDIDPDTNTLSSLIRGANGTTAATHADNAVAKVAPTWRRRAVFDAVADAVEALYPELYATDSEPLTISTSGPTEVSATVGFPLFFWGRATGSSHWAKYTVEFKDPFPNSTTGKAVVLPGCGSLTGDLVYAKAFDRPTDEDDDLEDLGIDPAWDRLVAISAVAWLVGGREVDPVAQNFLSEQLETQSFPVGSASRLRASLRREHEYLLGKAKRQLRNRFDVPVVRR